MTKQKEKEKVRITSYKWADADKLVAGIQRDGKSLQSKIHSVAICFLSHWANRPHDGAIVAEKMTALQNASPYHANSFSQWVGLMTGLQWSEEKSVWYVHKDQKFKKDALDRAKGEPFWEVSPPPKAKPFTDEMVIDTLQKILDKQARHAKKPVDGDDFSTKGNEFIRGAIAALKGENA